VRPVALGVGRGRDGRSACCVPPVQGTQEQIPRQSLSDASYRYDAWGRDLGTLAPGGGAVTAALASAIAARQPLRYAGYVYDAESALYYLSARHYDPATFQFLQKDPAKADGEDGAYQYCGGDPVGGVDPSGRRTIKNFVPVVQSWLNCFAVAMLVAVHQATGAWLGEKDETAFWYAGDPGCGGCPYLAPQAPLTETAKCDATSVIGGGRTSPTTSSTVTI
jgi:RHS repeat-associated protein